MVRRHRRPAAFHPRGGQPGFRQPRCRGCGKSDAVACEPQRDEVRSRPLLLRRDAGRWPYVHLLGARADGGRSDRRRDKSRVDVSSRALRPRRNQPVDQPAGRHAVKKIGIVLLAAAAIWVGADALLRVAVPVPAALCGPPPESTEFLDRNGEPLRVMLVDDLRYSRPVRLAEMSPHVVAATLAAEDARFYLHPGVDPFAVARAAFNRLRGAEPASGASTITQQLVKEPGPRTFGRKLHEILQAVRLEREWPKEKILAEYLNRLDYGNLRTGIAAASRYYFAKPPSDLSAAEAAFLAALPKAPGRLDPHRNRTGARERQLWILERMQQTGAIDAPGCARAASEPLALRPHRQDFAAPHFVDLLLQRRGILPGSGGAVRTTLDLGLNRRVEQALAAQLARMAKHNANGAAAVVLHNPTGEVLALAGSGDYFAAGAGQVNGAWIARSPGSAVKPFTYLLALERGATPATVVADVPATFSTPTGIYRPNNYNHRFHGPVSLRNALGNSLNVAAVRALEIAGGPAALHRLLRELGLSTLAHPAEHYGLGLTLGNGEVRLLELANAYATLARGGIHRGFRLLAGGSNDDTAGRRLFGEASAYLVSDMLADNRARAASFGLESYLAFPFPVACKTGTSSDYRDNWAVGYTPEFTVAVWLGNPDGEPMRAITGVTGAAPAMREIMNHLHATRGTGWFARPAAVREGFVHPLTGNSVAASCPAAVREIYANTPPPENPDDYDTKGRVMLPAEYREWLAGPQNGLGDTVACASREEDFRITSPASGTVYFLDPDLPPSAQRIPLVANGTGEITWSSGTLACDAGKPGPGAVLREGEHVITARSGNRTATTRITVLTL
ncbi:MAG: penicillin-binding protein 1C [Chthoniobacterales bacterium]|nr:penicillin-binding protein 1C [Chthoniobacterales bacterium]